MISVESNERFAVYASAYYNRDDACRCYMYADDGCDEIDTEYCDILRRFYRLATPSEIEHFHELMWKPGNNEDYFFVFSDLSVRSTSNDGIVIDEVRIRRGNCFRTREEAKAMAEKIKKLLKGGEK